MAFSCDLLEYIDRRLIANAERVADLQRVIDQEMGRKITQRDHNILLLLEREQLKAKSVITELTEMTAFARDAK